MAAIITQKFRVQNAIQLRKLFSTNSVYMFIGREETWSTSDNDLSSSSSSSGDSATSPADDIYNEHNHWYSMIGAKKVSYSNTSHAVRRVDWTSGTVYSQYDDRDSALYSKSFYVMTDELKVYKCISNNGGAASTEKPTSTGTGFIKNSTSTSDGYIWKYMFTVSELDAERFLSAGWIPVKTLSEDDGSDQWDVQQAAVAGRIEHYIVVSSGSGYSSAPTATIKGDGSSATATVSVSSGAITRVIQNAAGSDYTKARVVLSGGSGSGGVVRAVLSPPGGHGSDPVTELGASYVIIRSKFRFDETDFPIENDYRKIGLVVDPYKYGTTTVASSSTHSQSTKITLNTPLSYPLQLDSVVTIGGTISARVVESSEGSFRLNEILDGSFTTNVPAITGTNEIGGAVTISSATYSIETPELQPGTGKIIYIEQRSPITRVDQQSEDIRIIVQL